MPHEGLPESHQTFPGLEDNESVSALSYREHLVSAPVRLTPYISAAAKAFRLSHHESIRPLVPELGSLPEVVQDAGLVDVVQRGEGNGQRAAQRAEGRLGGGGCGMNQARTYSHFLFGLARG